MATEMTFEQRLAAFTLTYIYGSSTEAFLERVNWALAEGPEKQRAINAIAAAGQAVNTTPPTDELTTLFTLLDQAGVIREDGLLRDDVILVNMVEGEVKLVRFPAA